ncbi:hypothetical protein ZHAS_00002294 [Anopheles sinensis]|uniref:Very-long-chain (3R)-3-hydroxyacyl-CoA dehydratase n=1 Tax=Anopheles sinensis TaxID=74873 RepID=A0A084VC08_ANOSI|nr:hypothetical protein ZHAS_00002294 [Anopheles sinensis]
MAKRNVWSGEETMELLEIIKEKNAMELFANSARGKNEMNVYKMLEDEMKRNGFDGKDASQIYHKWKNLKRSFYQTKKMNKGRATCEFSEELAEILDQTYHPKKEAPVKRRSNNQSKTVRSQIISKLTKVQVENSEEFAKKYNELYDYEFKLYKRKEKEQVALFNQMIEQSKATLIERCRQIFLTPVVDESTDVVDDSNVVEIETTQINIESSEMAAKEPSPIVKAYLILYNGAQVLGWSYMLYQLLAYYTVDKGTDKTLWDYLGFTVILFQNAALLEIVHAFTRIVPSNPVITTFQVLSRVMVVCGVVMATPTGKVSPGLPLAILAWSITEIIRYGYYALNLVDAVPQLLIFLRYTTFIALYPIGVTGELLCFYWAQSHVAETKQWSVEMPNKYNFTFSYFYLLWMVMLLYIPLFPQLYLHMFAQRKKILGAAPSGGAASAKQKAK